MSTHEGHAPAHEGPKEHRERQPKEEMMIERMVGHVFWLDLRGRADLDFWKLDLKNPTIPREGIV